MEICFSFFTTESISSCITQFKTRIEDLIQRLQTDIPGARIAVVAHGDYCDSHKYMIENINSFTNVEDMCEWVRNFVGTTGGDNDKWHQLVLQEFQSLLWTSVSKKVLVMIGDAEPHESGYSGGRNAYNIDWRKEVIKLLSTNARVYGVQCGYYGSKIQSEYYMSTEDLYNKISKAPSGKCLKLDDFANIYDCLMAISYKEHDEKLLQNFETEVRTRATPIEKDLEAVFGSIRSENSEATITKPTSLPNNPLHTKSSTIKVLRSATATKRAARRTRAAPYKGKHEQIMDKTKEQCSHKYQLRNLPKLRREET